MKLKMIDNNPGIYIQSNNDGFNLDSMICAITLDTLNKSSNDLYAYKKVIGVDLI